MQQSARPKKIKIPIKKASDRHICFADPMGYFCSYHESLHFFTTVTLRTPPSLTKAQTHNGSKVKGARQTCKRPSPRKTNIQEPGRSQKKYASTRWHTKQICHHLAARETNMESPGGAQNKYAGSRQHEETNYEICGRPAARKSNVQAHNGTQNKYAMTCWHAKQICLRLLACETNMEAPSGTQNKWAGIRQHAKQIC